MLGYIRRSFVVNVALGVCVAGSFASAQVGVPQPDPIEPQSRIAAVVDGHTITAGEVEKLAMRRHGEDVLDGLIDNYLIEREAARLHVEVSEAEIDDQVQALAEAIKPKTLTEGLKDHRETLTELRDDFRHRLLALKLAAMSAAPGHFVRAHVILLKAESGDWAASTLADALAQAATIRKQFMAGANFEQLAEQYSADPIGRKRGGDIGVVYEGSRFDPAVVQAALQLKPGGIAGTPIKTASGYYLVMVSSTESRHPADEDILYKNAMSQYALYEGGRTLPQYLRNLRAKAIITRFLHP